ncbi:DUF6169 family protein [Flagellimonas oceanensis]|uniref:DUF6169 family protein n=1 Tax=Flagellimonas oceanensis TaxID=2499163 RepID=UPI003BAB71D3
MYEYTREEGDDGPLFLFSTEFGLSYIVSFRQMGKLNYPLHKLYSIDFLEKKGRKGKSDIKISTTILSIILQFIDENPECTLHYLCDINDGKQMHRAKLFTRWFSLCGANNWMKLDFKFDGAPEDYMLSFLFDSHVYDEELMQDEILLTLDMLESDKT